MLDKVSDEDETRVGKLALVEPLLRGQDTDVATEVPARDGASVSPTSENRRSYFFYAGKFLLAIIQGLLMVAILFGAFQIAKRMIAERPEPRKRPPFKTVYTIETARAVKASNQPVFVAYGQTAAARSVDLRSLVSGEIVNVHPNLRGGASVKEGEKLLEINEFEFRGALAEARANMAEAKARITESDAQITLEESRLSAAAEQRKFAMADLERAERLVKRRSITQQQLEARKLVVSQREQAVMQSQDTISVQKARKAQLQASLDRLQWRIDQAMRNLASTALKAPFNGVVLTSAAEVGRVITANDVVVSLYETGSLEVNFTLTDSQYGRLQISQAGLIGRPVEILWSVGGREYRYPAHIDRIGAEIASNRGGVGVIAALDDIDTGVVLRPGAFVEVRVPDIVFHDSYSVPDTAIYDNDKVYKAVDGKLVAQKVTVAAFDGDRAIIASGLSDGDEVLTTRITEVSDGLAVRKEGEPGANSGKAGEGQSAGKPGKAERNSAGDGRPKKQQE